jgi:hypothetical protein
MAWQDKYGSFIGLPFLETHVMVVADKKVRE